MVDSDDDAGPETDPETFAGGAQAIIREGAAAPTRVLQQDDFWCRGPSMWHLNFLEYAACVQRMPKKKVVQDDGSVKYVIPGTAPASGGAGRRRNFSAPFEAAHPLSTTHYQALRSKVMLPVLAGPPRPRASSWKGEAGREKFSRFYGGLFIPWFPPAPDGEPERLVCGYRSAEKYTADPDAFVDLMRRWQTEESALFRARFAAYVNIADSLLVKGRAKQASQVWRYRAVPPWSEVPDAPRRQLEMLAHMTTLGRWLLLSALFPISKRRWRIPLQRISLRARLWSPSSRPSWTTYAALPEGPLLVVTRSRHLLQPLL